MQEHGAWQSEHGAWQKEHGAQELAADRAVPALGARA